MLTTRAMNGLQGRTDLLVSLPIANVIRTILSCANPFLIIFIWSVDCKNLSDNSVQYPIVLSLYSAKGAFTNEKWELIGFL